MDDLKNNKKIIFICLLIVILFVGGNYLIDLYKKNTSEVILENSDEEIISYEANQYIPIYMTEEEMMNKYLTDFKNTMINNPSSAYNLLNEEYRKYKYNNIDEFISYVNELKSVAFYQLAVDKYDIKYINGKKVFDIVGTDGNRYIIKELSIMNYEVYLDNYTVTIK